TLYMTLLAAFKILLSRFTGQEDVVVGSPIAGRNHKEIEELIGFFVNTLVLRTDLSADPSFEQLLARVRRGALDAYAHQDVPFERLVEELQPQRDMSSTPLFQVMFVLQNNPLFVPLRGNPPATGEFPKLSMRPLLPLRPLATEGATANFDLTLSLQETDAGLYGAGEYNTDLFDATTIQRLFAHYVHLLEGAEGDPEKRFSELPWLTPGERHQLLVGWNDTGGEAPICPPPGEPAEPRSIHELFESRAARIPAAVALVFGDQRLSYGELNRRAGRLACCLRSLGVGPETVVGLCAQRSFGMLEGMLGILKAGGIYLPLDPGTPRQRLTFMLEDSGATVLVTAGDAGRDLPAGGRPVIAVEAAEAQRRDLPGRRVSPEQGAYVIYTSGSTGRPKGVLVSHRALAGYALSAADAYRIGPADRVLQFASMSFDASAEEIYPTLVRGAALVLRGAEPASVPEVLDQCRTAAVTVLNLPTAYWHTLTAEAGQGVAWPECVRLVIIGGEEALPAALDGWQRWVGDGVRLVNTYGPTEATIVATRWQGGAQGDASEALARVPIGRPIAGTRAYVLDRRLRPVAIGVVGELTLDGAGLARGYLGRPQRTAEGFVPHPFRHEPGRLYRTGDLVRRLPDGVLEFLGRIDHQVKVRGFRIELGEIEAVLSHSEAVRECAVVARGEGPGGRQLAAYVVTEPGSAAEARNLRELLQQSLPEYMVPSAFVFLEALPLLPSGKVNRAALPAPERRGVEADFAAPSGPTEELLAGIWAAVLKLDRVGVEDNFFELGGHSLLATQVISRLREVFGVEVALQKIFEAPTVKRLAPVVEAAAVEGRGRTVPPIRPLPRDGGVLQEGVALSFAQQRLWFIDQFQPGRALYNISNAVRLSDRLDRALLARSLNEIVRRHEALRTTFTSAGGRPVQRIAPVLELEIPVIDLRQLPAKGREAESRRLTTAETRRPFDLSRGPLLRVTVLQLAAEERVILLTIHHIVSDGWSMEVLIRELSALYTAFSEGQASPCGELAIQYADYALWQRQWLTGEVMEEELRYWRRQLVGIPRLELPTDRPRPAVQTFRGRTRGLAFSTELSGALLRLSREQGTTLFMTLLAGFKALLARTTGQEDIAVGSPIAGRNHRQIEDLIGFFVNTLVLRSDLAGNPSFRELLGRVRQVALDAYAHQELPFERLVEELEPERDLSTAPLFQVLFGVQNLPQGSLERPGLTLRPVAREESGTAKFDLTLMLQESGGEVRGGLEYNTDLFDDTTVGRLAAHLAQVLQGIVDDPERRLSELPWLTAAQRHQLLAEWRLTRTRYPREQSIHELFAARAEAMPDAAAVVCRETVLSYRELDVRANRLAHHLRALGVGAESLVGLAVERSVELAVGLLGILKAGGAYLPLDPTYPEERLRFILEDTAASVVLVDPESREQIAGMAGNGRSLRLVDLERDRETIAWRAAEPPPRCVASENLAYAMYTSGSTGWPKGVAVTHRSVVRLVRETGFADLSSREVFLQFAPVAFDASTLEIWAPLLNGGRLVIYPQARASLEELGAVIARHRVSTLWLTAGLFHRMVEDHPEGLRPLRQLLAGGDVLSPAHVAKVLRELPGLVLINGYGPTENTTFTCCHPMRESAQVGSPGGGQMGGSPVPIGRPIANTSICLLDRHLQPVAAGVVGELLTGGDGLARGYLRRPQLTAEQFIPDPLAAEAGGRLYRTGDLARFRADGTVEFLGRRDHQVKLRGFRIELGEIEAVLSRQGAVRESVVVVREDTPGDRRLVAYLVVEGETAPAAPELRDALKAALPDYMVPSALVVLEALPLTPNGKVDRAALPAPERSAPESAFVAPRDPIEELLAEIWAAVLGHGAPDRERVGVDDNFFELGGHSLLATQVASRIREAFAVELPLQRLFEAPTIAELAEVLRGLRRDEQGVSIPPLVPVARDRELPLSFAQQRLWFLDQLDPGSSAYNIPLAVRLGGVVEAALLERIFNAVVRRHEVLRTTFAVEAGEPRQVIAEELCLPLPVIALERLAVEDRRLEAERLATAEARRPFDLTTGPLIRFRLVGLAADEQVVMATMHHIVSDGWSIEIFLRELAAFSDAFSRGESSPLAELPIQYADFAHWQRQWLAGEVLEAQLGYWRARLAGAPPRLELPTDRPRPAVQTFRSRVLGMALSEPLSGALARLSREQGVTLYMTLLAAFKILLSR
ncbi:MAG: amino acid adenylation domain-containing protein, partial [bacterium]|nr:amino acid adenylation domain-containing protein [bacterium]